MNDQNGWWNALRHEGVLISPIVLDDWLRTGPIPVEDWRVDRLRNEYYRFCDDPGQLRSFLDALLEVFLGHTQNGVWRKEQHIPDRFKHQGKKPNRVLLNAAKEHQPRFLVMIDDRVAKDDGTPQRLGLHAGRKVYADLLRLMRASDVAIGILTNGHHVRLVYAGLDHESWAEWSVDAWFQGAEGRQAMAGFAALVGVGTLPPEPGSDANALLARIKESRDRQADLSHVMGTQVREAVEVLLESLTESLDDLSPEQQTDLMRPLYSLGRSKEEELGALYQGAIRCVMRLVVCLYAESRELLPKDDSTYYDSYSVEGLYQILRQANMDGQDDALKQMRSAWPRLVALWKAIHDGSPHKDLNIPAYGGQLFRSPSSDSRDPVLASLAILQDSRVHVSDQAVFQILQKLRIGKYKVGRKWLPGPVDFSDLRTEYIGMMYEGLLDYDLRRARDEDGGIVFLAMGDQPALPLTLLENQSPKDLQKLLAEQGKKKSSAPEVDEGDDEDEAPLAEQQDEEEVIEQDEDDDSSEAFYARVQAWAESAVNLVKKKGGTTFGVAGKRLCDPDPAVQKPAVAQAARNMVLRSVPPGGMYLVRWSGTRKGSGTFYTKPGLAVPTTVRTIEPLVYDNHEDLENRVPKKPDEILRLKICDPAMGSGSFLVAALRFTTRALKESFDHHILPRIEAGEAITDLGTGTTGLLTERILAARDDQDRDERVTAALKRAVVEHCIYGVDLNPLAVELGKLSLWIETMDPSLRFTFLDHKIKCGNSLIGAWRHQAEHYPLAAWDRQCGDGAKNPRTERLKKIRKEIILPELKTYLDGYKLERSETKQAKVKFQPKAGQQDLFGETAKQVTLKPQETVLRAVKVADQYRMDAPGWDSSLSDVQAHELAGLERIHANPNPQEQEDEYKALITSAGHRRNKYLLDRWCALWFWPINAGEDGMVEQTVLGPLDFYNKTESRQAMDVVEHVADKHRFFHWELEYPDVFGEERFGFDVVVGNPPWETAKPQDNEFFTKYDPAYRTYGKQEGLKKQKELFEANHAILSEFWDYQEWFKAQSTFFRNCHDLGSSKPGGKIYNNKWVAISNAARVHPAGMATPYRFRGSGNLNLFLLFFELGTGMVARGGRAGWILPTGLYSDPSTDDIRDWLLDDNSVDWIFSFENRRKIFAIDSRAKYACYILTRGPRTTRVRLRFYAHDLADWENAAPLCSTVQREELDDLIGILGTIPEIARPEDKQIIDKIRYGTGRLQDVAFSLATEEYHLTKEAGLFTPFADRPNDPDPAGVISADGHALLPAIAGKTFHSLRPFNKYFDGTTYAFRRHENPASHLYIVPERKTTYPGAVKIGYRRSTNSTNTRTLLATPLPHFPCGDKAPCVIVPSEANGLAVSASWSSYVLDFFMRNVLTSTNVSVEFLPKLPVAWNLDPGALKAVCELVDGPWWKYMGGIAGLSGQEPAPEKRARMQEYIDAAMADATGLTAIEMRWILRPDNPDPRNLWRDYRERLKVLEAAGHEGNWYTLEEAREIRRKAGMEVDF